ncbi:uncharacterized protein LOC109407123 isoform X1 [Aedes albopictus]|uniref:No apical meristem-associated C-terminal domain-containing protein n=1 Tax=Aedes albopictus TaxID=7160 RepID=A0ABM1YN96_AEDAL
MSASKARGKNWTVEEDEALCTAWLNVSQDGATGTYQRVDTLYERVYELFIEICTEKNLNCSAELRVPSGLKARWLLISKACSKFSGCVAQIYGRQQSGTTQSDVLKQAFTLYNTSTKSPFTLLHAFKILENAPKWKQYVDLKVSAANSSALKRRRLDEDESFEDDDPSATPSPSSPSRPMGQKAAKKLKQQQASHADIGAQMAKASNLLANAVKDKAVLSRERTAAINRMANHAIMSVDFSTLSETAKEFYRVEQERILQQILAENSRSGVFEPPNDEETSEDEEQGSEAAEACVDDEHDSELVEYDTDDD